MASQQTTPASTPGPNDTTQTGASKYAYKQCPPFDPTFYRAWASEVTLAFAEREWTSYLITPDNDPDNLDETFVPNPMVALRARAFLSQAIDFKYKAGMEHCETAAELFSSLQEQYGSTTREDEFRLETQLMFMRKLGTDSIDTHIAKFKTLIASVMAQQDASSKYKNDKRNQYFLATLEYSEIEDEKWETLIPFLGNTWKSMTPESLFSATRTYYYAHILPKKKKSTTTETSNAVEGSVYWTQGNSRNTNSSGNSNNFGNSNRGGRGGRGGRGRGGKSNYNNYGNSNNGNSNNGNFNNGNSSSNNSNNQPPRDKFDPTQFCHYHGKPGHSSESC